MNVSWSDMITPAAVLCATLIATLWVRRKAYGALDRWAKATRRQDDDLWLETIRLPSILWCLIVSAYLATQASDISGDWKYHISMVLWSLLILSIALSALSVAGKIIPFYGEKWRLPRNAARVATNVSRVFIMMVAGLTLLDLWGAPMSPILLAIGVLVLAAILAFRNALSNLSAWLQISASGHIKIGDYIRLESGEEGYVVEIDWRSTRVKAADQSTVLIPNSSLVRSTVVNYGKPLKQATEPFHFYSRAHLKELTGLKANNLKELAILLKSVPDSVIYYHTHQFLEEHHYLIPEPANDFALWVRDVLGDEVLGERLAAVDTFEFLTLAALRLRISDIIDEHLSHAPIQGYNHRDVPGGRAFYFIKSVSMIVQTPYIAHDLREFVEALRKVNLSTLYFHIFESRLRLANGLNDFSIWLQNSLDEPELAEAISRLDPYNYTLEGLRSWLIQLIEKRIK